MDLAAIDAADLFSLTMWRSADGYTVGIQKYAGDLVKYETRKTPSEAIAALLNVKTLPAPPY